MRLLPIPIIPGILRKLKEDADWVIMIALAWARQYRYSYLGNISIWWPITLPAHPDLVSSCNSEFNTWTHCNFSWLSGCWLGNIYGNEQLHCSAGHLTSVSKKDIRPSAFSKTLWPHLAQYGCFRQQHLLIIFWSTIFLHLMVSRLLKWLLHVFPLIQEPSSIMRS